MLRTHLASKMFNLGALAANVLNSLDNAAKDTLEEPKISATALRSQRQNAYNNESDSRRSDDEDNDEEDQPVQPEVPKPAPGPRRTSSGSSLGAVRLTQKQPDPVSSPPRSPSKSQRLGGGYALSYESSSNVSTASNDGDEPSSAEATGGGDSAGVAAVGIADVASEQQVDVASETFTAPSTPVSKVPLQDTPSEVAAQEAVPAPAAAVSTPQSIIGTLVSSISSSAKKLPLTGEGGMLGTPTAATTAASTTSAGAADADKAAKDSNKDKEILLLKKTLKKKNQEIEKLNRECLDFEEQTAALKLEVKEAWDNYKTAQEKSAAVESELQDEVRQIQKAKLLDKQQSVAQLGKMNEEVAEAMRQVQVAQAQRAELQSRLDAAAEESAQWEERLLAAQRELAEAKTGTVQGVAALREELRLAQVSAEQMRSDHSALVRQHQLRQADLERENAELVASVTQQQKELQRLQHQSSNNTGLFAANSSLENSDYITLQQELITLTGKYESEKDKFEELDRKVKITEREARAAQMNAEEERKRSAGTIDALSAKVAELESKLNSRKLQPAGFASGSGFLPSSAQGEVGGNGNDHGGEKHAESGDAGEGGAGGIPMHRAQSGFTLGDYEQVVRELAEHKAQSQNLSKLLLKKQGAVLELQAERSALKSRLIDMQARCSETERQLASLRDLEDGGGGGGGMGHDGFDAAGEDGESSAVTVGGSGGGLQLRRPGGAPGAGSLALRPRDNKVISDLERFGVKPGAGVTRAVNVIDSWTMLTGRFLRMYPLARLGFVLYLLVLHLWVLFILVLQTHSLELDTDPRDQLKP